MTNNTKPATMTIVLTGRAPVKIRKEEWPQIASGLYYAHDNEYAFQANREWKCNIYVRQHSDGRTIVYGVYNYETKFQSERDFRAQAGYLVEAEAAGPKETVVAIGEVASALTAAAEEAGHDFLAHISEAERGCIADLPPEEL